MVSVIILSLSGSDDMAAYFLNYEKTRVFKPDENGSPRSFIGAKVYSGNNL